MGFHDGPGQEQAQPQAGSSLLMPPIEGLEQPVQILRRDPRAGVLNPDPYLPIPTPGLHPNTPSGRRELHGVVHQVVQRLGQPVGIRHD